MEIKEHHVYEGSFDDFRKHYLDPNKIVSKYEALGSRKVCVEPKEARGECEIVISREVTADVPRILAKFFKPWNRVTQTETWTDSSDRLTGRIKVSIESVPVAVSSQIVLTRRQNSCVQDIETKVESNIPLIGSKLAAFVAENTRKYILDERAYMKELL